jgi:hypothetical protein
MDLRWDDEHKDWVFNLDGHQHVFSDEQMNALLSFLVEWKMQTSALISHDETTH